MKARFDDICKSCGFGIKVGGHDITIDDSGRWIHKDCNPDENQTHNWSASEAIGESLQLSVLGFTIIEIFWFAFFHRS